MTSTLDAINQMLSAIGEQPVSSLDGDRSQDVSNALAILNEVCGDKQLIGWRWNTEFNYSLPLDDSSRIPVPTDAIFIEIGPQCNWSIDPEVRGAFLYDRKNHTDIFAQPLTVAKLVRGLDFETTPEDFRRYVTIRAARIFVQRTLGSAAVGYAASDETNAWAAVCASEMRATRPNMNSGPLVREIVIRRSWK